MDMRTYRAAGQPKMSERQTKAVVCKITNPYLNRNGVSRSVKKCIEHININKSVEMKGLTLSLWNA